MPLKKPEEFRVDREGRFSARTSHRKRMAARSLVLDVRVPGMVYAVVARCPAFGGKVKSFDASKAKAMKGVHDVFEIPPVEEVHSCGGVAVVAETTYIAMQARKQLQIDWDYRPARYREQ